MFKRRWKKAMKATKEKAIFRLEFHASQVPQRGWDKLLVSLVSLDTGKVIAKTGNAPVTKGTCQWSEPLFGSIHVSRYFNGKDAGKELYKLEVSMGLSRFGILGVTTINLVDYMLATTPVSLPLPLEGCSFGSILHVKIQRIMPMSTSRDLEDQKEVHLGQDLQLATSDVGQQTEFELMLSGNNVADSGQGKPSIENKDDASVLSPARNSFNSSVDVPSTPGVSESCFYGRDGLGDNEFMLLSRSMSSSGRHEAGSGFHDKNQEFMSELTLPETLVKPGTSVDSYSSSPYHSECSPDGNNGQNQEWISHEWGFPGNSSCSSHNIESYNDESRWETGQRWTHPHSTGSVAIAASWEGDGNQVVVSEIDVLKLQLANETKRSKEVHKKLSVVMAERDSIKQEMEKLKSLEKSNTWKGGLKWHQKVQEDTSRHAIELQDELDYEKSLNSSLSFQLQKTQESNSELLLEIQNLEKLLQENKLQKTVNANKPESGNGRIEDTNKDPSKLVDTLQKELEELKRDSQKLTVENLDLLLQLKQANEKMTDKDDTIAQLEIKITHINKASIADYIQVMGGLKAERVELDRETLVFLEAREAADASGSQFQTLNAMLQEQLHQEQLKISKILQQSKEHEANSLQRYQAFNVAQAQVKSMEQIIELETARKEIECKVRDFHEENKLSRSRIIDLELHMAALEDETDSLKASRSALEDKLQDLKSRKEIFKSQEESMKATMKEQISHLQEVSEKGSRQPLEGKNSELNELLQKQTSDLTHKLSEQEVEQQELKTMVFYLGEELQDMVNALAYAEKRLKEQRETFADGGRSQVSFPTGSLSRANRRIRPMSIIPPSREAKEVSNLGEKVKLLECEASQKAAELEASKQQSKEQHTHHSTGIEYLELANEKEHLNLNMNHVLKEEKELESALLKFNVAAKGENILNRISNLETELAEVLEANIMHKSQLQSAFAKQQNVHAAALENLGSVEQVINDLAELKRKNLMLEDDLCDMRQRYSNMSLQFAQLHAEREELVMTIRNLQGIKKLMPYKSLNF